MRSKIVYIGLSYSIQFLNIILNLLFMQRLSVQTLGDLAIAKVWLQAFDYSHLGSRFALDRFLPVLHQAKQRHLYLLIALTVVITGSLLVLFVSLIAEQANSIVLAFCLVGISLAVGNVLKAYFRATADIVQVNNIVARLYVLPLTISVAFAAYDFDWFLWVYPFSFVSALLYFSVPFIIQFKFKTFSLIRIRIVFFKVLSVSKLLFVNALIVYSTLIVDRLFVDLTLGRDALGQYSIIMFVFASLFTVPSILTELIFPKIVQQVVNDGKRFFWKETVFVFFTTLLIVVISNVVMYFIVVNYTPYEKLIPLMQLASLAVLPYSFSSIIHHVLNALDKRHILMITNASILIIACISFYFLSRGVVDLESIILIKVFVALLNAIFLLFVLKMTVGRND